MQLARSLDSSRVAQRSRRLARADLCASAVPEFTAGTRIACCGARALDIVWAPSEPSPDAAPLPPLAAFASKVMQRHWQGLLLLRILR